MNSTSREMLSPCVEEVVKIPQPQLQLCDLSKEVDACRPFPEVDICRKTDADVSCSNLMGIITLARFPVISHLSNRKVR